MKVPFTDSFRLLGLSVLCTSLWAATALARSTPELVGPPPNVYTKVSITAGNLYALQEQNRKMKSRMENGMTPQELAIFAAMDHPVLAAGDFAKDVTASIADAIPLSPGPQTPTDRAPADILTGVDQGLRKYFTGYANLAAQAGDGTIGLTFMSSNPTYELDQRFLNSTDVVLARTTPVLNIKLEGSLYNSSGSAEGPKQDEASVLDSVRNALMATLPTNVPLAAALGILALMAVGLLKAKGYRSVANVVDTPEPMVTNLLTVEVHEQQHLTDRLGMDKNGPLKSAYLDPSHPLHSIVESLLEVRAGLAEVLSSGKVNVPYLSLNVANLQNALSSQQSQLPSDLLSMASLDLKYAQSWLQEHESEFINF